jgi:hypothetical protein
MLYFFFGPVNSDKKRVTTKHTAMRRDNVGLFGGKLELDAQQLGRRSECTSNHSVLHHRSGVPNGIDTATIGMNLNSVQLALGINQGHSGIFKLEVEIGGSVEHELNVGVELVVFG